VQLTLVRHGQTAWNALGRFQGHRDIALSEEGYRQAAAVAKALASDPISAAFSSDLARASETARIVISSHHIELQLDSRLREFDFGSWEGLTWDEIVASDPQAAVRLRTSARDYRPTGGESFAQVRLRLASFLDDLQRSSFEYTLIVAHAGTLHALVGELLGERFDEVETVFSHGSISRLRWENGSARIISLNDVAHLNPARTS